MPKILSLTVGILLSTLTFSSFASVQKSLYESLTDRFTVQNGGLIKNLFRSAFLREEPEEFLTGIELPVINSLETWMTDLKQDPNFSSFTIQQVLLPASHHAGLTGIIYDMEILMSLARLLGLEDKLKQFDQSIIEPICNNLAVPQSNDMGAEVLGGARYFDVRIGQERNDTDVVVLRHMFSSAIYLENLLGTFAAFIEKNPQEILILDISNDYQSVSPVSLVDDAILEALVLKHIDARFILGKEHLQKPIGSYGGIYFTGFKGTKISTIAYHASWSTTQHSNPDTVVKNVLNYVNTNVAMLTPPYNEFDIFKSDFYITATTETTIESVLYELETLIMAPNGFNRLDPANLKNAARESNPQTIKTIDNSATL